jgi:hypothetical protein
MKGKQGFFQGQGCLFSGGDFLGSPGSVEEAGPAVPSPGKPSLAGFTQAFIFSQNHMFFVSLTIVGNLTRLFNLCD